MQQRRLRLGDILDDYCPRERRITNHAVVAMIDDQVKQTRCTTCDADHDYKQAKAPSTRRKKVGGALFAEGTETVAGVRPTLSATVPSPFEQESAHNLASDLHDDDAPASDPAETTDLPDEQLAADGDGDADVDVDEPIVEDDGFVHRRLIRATLPRPEGQVPERKAPDFTMRQQTGGGRFGQHRNNGNGMGNGNGGGQGNNRGGGRPMRAGQGQGGGQPARFSGPRQPGQGAPQGSRQGNRPGQNAGQNAGQRSGGRPAGQHRGPASGQGRKRGR